MIFAEIVAMALAPCAVARRKRFQAGSAHTVHMPEGVHKINPLLTTVRAGGAGELGSDSRIGLLKQSNEVVGTGGTVLAGELELPVQGFEFIAFCIHGSILPEFCPVVKGIERNTLGWVVRNGRIIIAIQNWLNYIANMQVQVIK